MLGLQMMLKSIGLEPEMIESQVKSMMRDVAIFREEAQRQGRLLDAIARKLEINPREFDAPSVKEIDQ